MVDLRSVITWVSVRTCLVSDNYLKEADDDGFFLISFNSYNSCVTGNFNFDIMKVLNQILKDLTLPFNYKFYFEFNKTPPYYRCLFNML